MAITLARLRLYLSTNSEQRQEARAARRAGNLYRDRGEWAEAAASYSRFLEVFRSDFAIWVQLGHMLKEGGHFDDAERAYTRAAEIRSDDADLLLNLGHLRKRQNRVQEAATFYRRAIRVNGSSDAFAELRRLPVGAQVQGSDEDVQDVRNPRVEQAIGRRMSGARVVQASGFAGKGADGRFRLTGLDPQLHFELDEDIRLSAVAVLEIDAQVVGYDGPCEGTLFLDRGAGFEPRDTVRLRHRAGNPIRLFVAAPQSVRRVRWDPVEGQDVKLRLSSIRAIGIPTVAHLLELVQSIMPDASENAPDPKAIEAHLTPFFSGSRTLEKADAIAMEPFLPPWRAKAFDYGLWLALYGQADATDRERMRLLIDEMTWKPRFSFVMPTYNTPIPLLRGIVDAMLLQTYPHFEICIADDCSSDPAIVEELRRYAAMDNRVRYVTRNLNGHISHASNSAAALSTGDFIVLVDHDDLIPDYALFVAAAYINRFPDAHILFSDEDKIDIGGKRSNPYFKSCYNQYLMYGHNMVSHLGIYQRDLFERVGGFQPGLEGSQDYDLFLRCAEQVNPHQIVHIPHVLYHWRQVEGSTAVSVDEKDYAASAAHRAITGQFERLGLPFRSVEGHTPGSNAIAIAPEREDIWVSVVIHPRSSPDQLDRCLASLARWRPVCLEVLLVTTDSTAGSAFVQLGERYPDLAVRIISVPSTHGIAQARNVATQARGVILCFLDDDLEVQSPGWLDRARGLLAIEDIGVVGARLLHPDGTLDHFGLVTGMGDHGIAGNVHSGEEKHGHGYFGKHRLTGEFAAVSGSCLFVRKRDFQACGGFTPHLSIAYHDVDLCLKIRASGRRVLCDPAIELVRAGTRAPDDAEERQRAADAAWITAHWGSAGLDDLYYSPNLSLDRLDFAYAFPPRQPWPWQMDPSGRPAVASGRLARAPRYFKDGRRGDRGHLAICAILKNEACNILEWIAYHHAIGVEKFYLYDNNSTDNVWKLLQPLVETGLVDLIPWPINPGQTQAYDDFADRHGRGWTWAAFIDLDEFINPFGNESLTQWLSDFPDASAIALQWVNFGPNGHDDPPAGLMLEAYTTRFGDPHMVHGHVKVIVRMADYVRAIGPHSFQLRGQLVDEYGEAIDQTVDCAILPVRQHRAICVNHYYTRSRSEWRIKLARGMADHGTDTTIRREPDWLGIYEREAIVHDDRILRFAERTRQMLTTLGLPIGPQMTDAGAS